MTKIKHDINSWFLGLEEALQLYKSYGIFGIFKGFFILIMLSITLQICYNPGFLFDRYTEYMSKKHIIDLQIRTEYDEKLKSLLPVYLYKYRADRVWIIQYHNGVMDWQHGTMRFELCSDSTSSIRNQYDNFNLTWLNIPYYLKNKEVFIGSLLDLYKIDKTLCTQFEKNNVQYLACTVIRDNNSYPIGIFGVTWETIPTSIDIDKVRNYLIDDRANIKPLVQLNYSKK